MWKQLKVPFFGLIALLLTSVVMIGNGFALTLPPIGPIPPGLLSSYYIVTQLDPRLCPSPLCGGYFVKEVNKPKTQCADGTWQPQCHAASLDASGLGWSSNLLTSFSQQFGQRHALVRGSLQQRPFGSFKVDILMVDEGWQGQALSNPVGTFYGLKASGILCITFPCQSIQERELNFQTQRLIADVDLAASGASPDKVAAGRAALSQSAGILAAGEHKQITGPAGSGLKLVTSEFYLLVAPTSPPVGQACGGIQGLACPSGQYCDITTPNACGGADLSGTCRVRPQVCYLIYNPVCGCDGVTYANDCERQAAMMQLDHAGACQKTP